MPEGAIRSFAAGVALLLLAAMGGHGSLPAAATDPAGVCEDGNPPRPVHDDIAAWSLSEILTHMSQAVPISPAGSATPWLNAFKAGGQTQGGQDPFGLGAYLTRPVHLDSYRDVGAHFRIHFASEGRDLPANLGATGYLEVAAATLQEVARVYHGAEQQWPRPPADRLGGDERIDVYILDLGPSVYGYSLHEESEDAAGHAGFIVIDNDFAGLAVAGIEDALRLTLAHEYHHLIQFGYGYDVEASWFMEQLATMEEGRVYPDLRDRERYLPALLLEPYRALDLGNGSHEYGAWLWPEYLQRRFGWGLLRRAWDIWRDAPVPMIEALDRALREWGSDLDEAFLEWAVWNVCLGRSPLGEPYGAAVAGPERIGIERSFSRYPVLNRGPELTRQPGRLGASYLQLRPQADSADNVLQLDVRGCATLCGVRLLLWRPSNLEPEVLVPESKSDRLAFRVEDWAQVEEAILVIANGQTARHGCNYAVTAVSRYETASVPDQAGSAVGLHNCPNPFEPYTLIQFELPAPSAVTLRIYDAQGRQVLSLLDGRVSAGRHAHFWRGQDAQGLPVPGGLYYGRLEANGHQYQLKMILVR
jgi:hypothetical protein